MIACEILSKRHRNQYPIMVKFALLAALLVQGVVGENGAVILMQEGSEAAVEIRGHFGKIGGAVSVQGEVRRLSGNCTKSTQPLTGPIDSKDWIGLIYLPSVEETMKEHISSKPTKCSLLDQVKNAMLFGASALIVLAMNPALLKELDVEQLFKQPVIVIQEAVGISKMYKVVQGKSRVSVKINEVTKPQSYYWSTARLTLWSTCGRSNGGTYKE